MANHCQCVPVCIVAESCLTLCNPLDCSPSGSFVHTGVGCHVLLQGIFPTQESNLRHLHLL